MYNGKADRGRHGPLPYTRQQVNIYYPSANTAGVIIVSAGHPWTVEVKKAMVNASATESTTLDIEGMEHHGTPWNVMG